MIVQLCPVNSLIMEFVFRHEIHHYEVIPPHTQNQKNYNFDFYATLSLLLCQYIHCSGV